MPLAVLLGDPELYRFAAPTLQYVPTLGLEETREGRQVDGRNGRGTRVEVVEQSLSLFLTDFTLDHDGLPGRSRLRRMSTSAFLLTHPSAEELSVGGVLRLEPVESKAVGGTTDFGPQAIEPLLDVVREFVRRDVGGAVEKSPELDLERLNVPFE